MHDTFQVHRRATVFWYNKTSAEIVLRACCSTISCLDTHLSVHLRRRSRDCSRSQEAVSMWYSIVSAVRAEAGQVVQGKRFPEKDSFGGHLQTVQKTACPTRWQILINNTVANKTTV